MIPYNWANWDYFQRCLGSKFIEWAEPAPKNDNEERYAIIADCGSIVWARFSPNPSVRYERSQGAFYDDMPGGAIESAKKAAKLHKEKIIKLLEDIK